MQDRLNVRLVLEATTPAGEPYTRAEFVYSDLPRDAFVRMQQQGMAALHAFGEAEDAARAAAAPVAGKPKRK